MHRIDNGTQASSLPTMAAAGTPGYFQHGVSGVSTIVDQDWANDQQENPAQFVEATGLALIKGDFTQQLKATQRLAAAFCTSLTASATLTAANLGLVVVDASAGAITLTLPPALCMTANIPGRIVIYRKDTTSANSVTVQCAGSDAIFGTTATSFAVACKQTVRLQSDGSASWHSDRTLTAADSLVDASPAPVSAAYLQALLNANGYRNMASWAATDATFTVPAGVTKIRAFVTGGGGAGCNCNSNLANSGNFSGSGGGAAATVIAELSVTPGQVLTIHAAAARGGENDGDASYVSGYVSVPGGTAGHFQSAGASAGGAPGSGATVASGVPALILAGGFGSDGQGGGIWGFGNGGASFWGGGGRAGNNGGINAEAWGSGGGGAYNGTAGWGGAGAPGCVFFFY